MLFIIPWGGGIPAGVLLARNYNIAWPATAGLYFISDVILAFLFEPVLRLIILMGRSRPALARMIGIFKQTMNQITSRYRGAGPLALVMIAFGVDPMTGRAAAAAAGHGFIAGWTIAITGDMLYFGVVMVATLRLNSVVGNQYWTMVVIMGAMFLFPILVQRLKLAYCRWREPGV